MGSNPVGGAEASFTCECLQAFLVRFQNVPPSLWALELWGRAKVGEQVLKTRFLSSHDSNDLQLLPR
jgi:hypothetical protein